MLVEMGYTNHMLLFLSLSKRFHGKNESFLCHDPSHYGNYAQFMSA